MVKNTHKKNIQSNTEIGAFGRDMALCVHFYTESIMVTEVIPQ